MKTKKSISILISTIILLSLTIVACQQAAKAPATAAPAAKAPATAAPAAKEKKVFNIVLNNNYIGNQWRLEMQNIAVAMAKNNDPYKGNVNLKVVVSEGDPTAQIQALESIIATKPDAILVDASSPSALNPVLKKACDAGIVVVSFDQYVTEPCTYRVIVQNAKNYQSNGEWLIKTMGGKGNILHDLGFSGNPNDMISNDVLLRMYAANPSIKVVGTYEGAYAPGPSQIAVANALASGLKIDAVYNLAGTDGIIQAYIQAGAPDKLRFVPIAATGDMVVRMLELIRQYKVDVQTAWTPPTFGGYALDTAWRVLNGEDPVNIAWGLKKGTDDRQILLPLIVYNTNGITTSVDAEVRSMKDLYSYLDQGLAPDTQLPYSIPESPVTKEQVFGK